MKKIILLGLLFLLAGCGEITKETSNNIEQPPIKAIVTGYVYNHGIFYSGINVFLVGQCSAVTDNHGKFTFINVTPGNYTLMAAAQSGQTESVIWHRAITVVIGTNNVTLGDLESGFQ